jgi:hypothetical protein
MHDSDTRIYVLSDICKDNSLLCKIDNSINFGVMYELEKPTINGHNPEPRNTSVKTAEQNQVISCEEGKIL